MPEPLPFEFPIRPRNVKSVRDAEINWRALEDYLATIQTGTGTGTAPQAAASWQNNDAGLSGTPSDVYWQLSPYTWSEGYEAYVQMEGGETNNRIHIYTPGFYTCTMDVEASSGTITHSVTAHAAGMAGATGRAVGDTLDGNTSFVAYAMQADDYFTASVAGDGATFAAYVTVEYVAPYGGATAVEEG